MNLRNNHLPILFCSSGHTNYQSSFKMKISANYEKDRLTLKGQGHVTINKPVISRIYIVAHKWSSCAAQISVDGVAFVSPCSRRVHLQNDTFILRKEVENHWYMAYQNYCKIVVSKEVCLNYVTLPL